MNRIKLPSGAIVDLEAVSMMGVPSDDFDGAMRVGAVIAGADVVFRGDDAAALYAAVEATSVPDVAGAVELLADAIGRMPTGVARAFVATAIERLTPGGASWDEYKDIPAAASPRMSTSARMSIIEAVDRIPVDDSIGAAGLLRGLLAEEEK